MSQAFPVPNREATVAGEPSAHAVPALIADAGERATWRYVEFFTTNIRNPNTRRGYARACARFFGWCEHLGLTLTTIRPIDVATYIEVLQRSPLCAGSQAAAGGHTNVVRLADHRPGGAGKPGFGRPRTEARGENR